MEHVYRHAVNFSVTWVTRTVLLPFQEKSAMQTLHACAARQDAVVAVKPQCRHTEACALMGYLDLLLTLHQGFTKHQTS